ncbi:MAG: twitching motility protein PilT [Bacteroidetes bacterium GWA2_31_9]|nr:MAG: twitching motility protein PilT [Bacteroidetes bacterium GWA2_31_9]
MKVFIDANIVVSVLNKEYPLFTYSSRILSLSNSKEFELFTSPICLAIAFYFSEKKSGKELARKKMDYLCSNILITEIGNNEVSKVISNKKIHDFEDGMDYYSALSSGCKCIVTEDKDDFYFSEIEVLNCVEFFDKYF